MSSNVLYRFYSADGELLYIGITNDAWRRFSQHRADKTWWPEVATICQQTLATREELSTAESRAIQSEHPRYNINGNGTGVQDPLDSPQPNGLVGKWFHSWEPATDDNSKYATVRCGRVVVWQGRIVKQVDSQRYLIQLCSWWDGEPGRRQLMDIEGMSAWTFYSSNIEMIAALGCAEKDCSSSAEYITDLSPLAMVGSAVCGTCAAHYSRVRPIVWKNDVASLGERTTVRDQW